MLIPTYDCAPLRKQAGNSTQKDNEVIDIFKIQKGKDRRKKSSSD